MTSEKEFLIGHTFRTLEKILKDYHRHEFFYESVDEDLHMLRDIHEVMENTKMRLGKMGNKSLEEALR